MKRVLLAVGFWLLALVIGFAFIFVAMNFVRPASILWFVIILPLFLLIDAGLIFLYLKIFREVITKYFIEGIKIAILWTALFLIFDVAVAVLIEGRPLGYLVTEVPCYFVVFISGWLAGFLAERTFTE